MAERSDNEIAIIVLAAGSSSRLGRSKQLLVVGRETLLEKSVKTALAKCKNVIVVLGANEQEHRAAIEHYPATVVFNPDWKNGMGNSLKAGLGHAVFRLSNPGAVIIMACDQPMLTTVHLDELIERYATTHKPIIASYYSGSAGVPVLFDKSMFPDLYAIDDRQGAKKIINSRKEFVEVVDFPGGSMDLDTPEDVERFFNARSGG
jgi:molybdenum cofactor cytidylyltransferase